MPAIRDAPKLFRDFSRFVLASGKFPDILSPYQPGKAPWQRMGMRQMGKRLTTLSLLRNHARVELVDDEREIGNGVIVTLKQGWTFDPAQDNRVSGEDTPAEAYSAVQMAHPFAGPYDD